MMLLSEDSFISSPSVLGEESSTLAARNGAGLPRRRLELPGAQGLESKSEAGPGLF